MGSLARAALPMYLLFFLLSVLGPPVLARDGYVEAMVDGQEVLVPDNRKPAIFTGDYGDCMGGSSINVTRFDAAYYKDNMTVLFHLGGDTALENEAIMMYIGVFAYGESRFDLTFNPCSANIYSACPVQAGTPIQANGVIPISDEDVSGIPELALSIPDFEGEAILRIFSNSTQTEIGCYSAVLTNGHTFSHPEAVSSILGGFTCITVLASFATAIYGDNIPVVRTHYAHSLSVLVIFAVWHHIFYTGALSMNWPSVLVSFWSNYAWAGGMIYSEGMQNTINNFIGSNNGNVSAVGAAGTGTENPNLGGGYDIHQIYKRSVFPKALNVPGLMRRSKYNLVARRVEDALAKRALADHSTGFEWYGQPVRPGLPLPGNYSGFAGTLAPERIPASNAFMTGFLWFLILIVVVAFLVVAFKFTLEGMSKTKMIKTDRLAFFRSHYLGYTTLAVLRTLFIGFFMIVFLCLFQFAYLASAGPVAVACIVFLIMLFGLGGLAGYACFYRIKFGNYVSEPDRLNVEKRKVMKVIPWYGLTRNSKNPRSEDKAYAGSVPWWKISAASQEKSIHQDEEFTKKFGWLASRFRKTRWWFFVIWLVYEFIRACFLAGAATAPLAQVFGLLVVEVIAFIGLIYLRPFEGQRLNIIVVYCLGFSKVVTTGLSAAFHTGFALARIPATVLGIVIIVVQGILTIVVLICVVVGTISTYMSLTRNRERFRPGRWVPTREKYLAHMSFKEQDIPRPPPAPKAEPEPEPEPDVPKEPYFSVNTIRRMAKIEDEDPEFMNEAYGDASTSQLSLSAHNKNGGGDAPIQRSRAPSRAGSIRSQMSYSSLPHGARVHRGSWSSHDFNEYYPPVPARRRTTSNSMNYTPEGSRPASRTPLPPLNVGMARSSDHVNRMPSPSSPTKPMSPIVSPVSPGAEIEGASSSPAVRPKSRVSVKSAKGRPQLQPLMSENEIPTLSQTTNVHGAKDTDEAK